MTTLTWHREPHTGRYVADLPDGDPSGVSRYLILNTGPRRWEIISLVGLERLRHGACYTLREAKEVTGNFYTQRLAWAAQDAAVSQ